MTDDTTTTTNERSCKLCEHRHTDRHDQPCQDCLVHELRTRERNTLWEPKRQRVLDFFAILEVSWKAFLAAAQDTVAHRDAFRGVLGLIAFDTNSAGEVGVVHDAVLPLIGGPFDALVVKAMDTYLDNGAQAVLTVSMGKRAEREYPVGLTDVQRHEHDRLLGRGPVTEADATEEVLFGCVYFQTGHVGNFVAVVPEEGPLEAPVFYGCAPGQHRGSLAPKVCNTAHEIEEC